MDQDNHQSTFTPSNLTNQGNVLKQSRFKRFFSKKTILVTLVILLFLVLKNSANEQKKPDTTSSNQPIPSNSLNTITSKKPYLLSSTGIQAYSGKTPFFQYSYPIKELAQDVDILTLFLEHYGIPWDEFAQNSEPPSFHPWTKAMNQMANDAQATKKDIFLQLSFTRKALEGKAVNDGQGNLKIDDWPGNTPEGNCYDFGNDKSKRKEAYLNYVKWMVIKFHPKYVNVAIEINDYWKDCTKGNLFAGSKWDKVVSIEGEAYDMVKSIDSSIVTFPSFILHVVYNDNPDGFDKGAFDALSKLKRDRLAVTVYPYLMQRGGKYVKPQELPQDFFNRVNKNNEILIIAETGWNSSTLRTGSPQSCQDLIPSNDKDQAIYLQFILDQAQKNNIEIIDWWSNRDIYPPQVITTCYPPLDKCGNDPWCSADNVFKDAVKENPQFGEIIFKIWGAMGIRTYDGTPKPIYNLWQSARGRK